MTKANRQGYAINVSEAKNIYLRRAHPKDPVELVIGWGNHDCTIVRLSPEQHEAITRDSHDLWFKRCVLA